jgi:hypothetical protein
MNSLFERAKRAVMRLIDAHENAAVARVRDLMNGFRLAIVARMVESGMAVNAVPAFRSTQIAIGGTVDEYERRIGQQVTADVAVAIELGAELIDKPMEAMSMNPLPLNPPSVEAAQLFALDRVKGLTADVRDKVAGILRRVLGGAISVDDAIKEVGASLNSKGAFKSFAARAELIVRQEILTAQSQATQQRMELRAKQMSAAGYELRKAWLTAHDLRVRPAHIVAGLTYTSETAIPVDEPFIVDDEELLYPRDPSGSADNILGCRCVSQPVVVKAAQSAAA